jgi:NTP pyrophosphatase (non-canonical NTP hydrolase)
MLHRETDIVMWAQARNIIGPTGQATRESQAKKTMDEVVELMVAIGMHDTAAARDAIGDIIVTLVIQAQMWNLHIDECVEAAWQQIKDRKGRMVNGVFVKEA